MLRITISLLLVASFVSAEDSPLVALSKRSNRKASKTPVITNETLKRTNVDYTSTDAPPPLPSQPQTVAAPTPKPVTRLQATTPAAAPPKQAQTTLTPPPNSRMPESSARNAEARSTVQVVQPVSTARSSNPTVGARSYDPASTVRVVQPTSTVRTIDPNAPKP